MEMMNETKKLEATCPNWDLGKRKECGISQGGMYLPMPEHVSMYCLSEDFPQCQQYIKVCGSVLAQCGFDNIKSVQKQERRTFRRYSRNLFLDLVASDDNVGPHKVINHIAKTIDLSFGGLKLESSQEFSTDTVISFVMNPELSSECLIGVGEVKWCTPKYESGLFESGIAFSNYSTSECVIEYLK